MGIGPRANRGATIGISFSFVRNKHLIRLGVPLLAVIPVPCVTVHRISVGFGTGVDTSSSAATRAGRSMSGSTTLGTSTDVEFKYFGVGTSVGTDCSSGGSSGTASSSGCDMRCAVSITMGTKRSDVPTNLSGVLRLLNGSLSISSPTNALRIGDGLLLVRGNGRAMQLVTACGSNDNLLTPSGLAVAKAKTGTTSFGMDNSDGVVSLPRNACAVGTRKDGGRIVIRIGGSATAPRRRMARWHWLGLGGSCCNSIGFDGQLCVT